MSRTGSRPEPAGDAGLHQIDNARCGRLRVVGLDEVEIAPGLGAGQVGHLAAVDPVRAGDDPAGRRLAEDLGQPHHRHRPRTDQVRQHLAGPNRRELIHVAHHQQGGRCGDRPGQRVHQLHIDHGGLVDDQQIAFQGVIGSAPEPAGARIDLQQAMDRSGLEPARLAHPLRRPPGGGRAQDRYPLGGEDGEDCPHDRRLADAGPAGDHQQLRGKGKADRLALALGERHADSPLDPGDGFFRLDRRPGQRAGRDRPQPFGDAALGVVEAGEEDAVRLADAIGDHRAVGQLQIERGADQCLRHLEQALRERDQFRDRQAAMALVHRLGEGVADAGADADHRGLLNAEAGGDGIRGLEADAAYVARDPVRVLAHHLDSAGPVGLEDAHGASRADAVAVQKHHDLADHLLLGPGIDDALRPDLAGPAHLAQALRSALDDVEHLLAEAADQLLRVDRADAADHAGAEIALDPLGRGRRRGLQEPRLELLAVGAVVAPFAGGGDPLAGGVTDDGDEVAMPARLHPHGEAALRIVERHPLDDAGEHFAIGPGGLVLGHRLVPSGGRKRGEQVGVIVGWPVDPCAHRPDTQRVLGRRVQPRCGVTLGLAEP